MTPSRPPSRLAWLVALATGVAGLTLVPTASAAGAPVDLAGGKPTSESGHTQDYASGNITDGNAATYWESPNNAFPQWVQVDLGEEAEVESLTLALPSGWEARSQTIAVAASSDGSAFSTIRSAAGVAFPGGANAVDVDVDDTTARYVRLTFTSNSAWPAGQLSELKVLGTSSDGPSSASELAHGRPTQASSTVYAFAAGNAVDGDVTSYWESGAGAYPATLTTQLAQPSDLTSVVLKLNPAAVWAARTQTIAIEGRAQGATTFSTLAPAAQRTFSPASQNTVTIPVAASGIEEVRVRVTANSGAPGAQLAELQVWGTASDAPDVGPNLTVSNLTASPAAPTPSSPITLGATVTNTGTANSAPSTVAFSLGGQSVGTASVIALAPGASAQVSLAVGTRPAGGYPVTATVDPSNAQVELDEGDNTASGVTVTVADDGQPDGDATERAAGRPIQASSTTWIYTADKANDGDTTTYWESGAGAYPATLSVTLSPKVSLDRVVLKLNPDAAWATRTQTLAIEGRAQGSTSFTTLKASATYTFSPSGQNTVTIPVTGAGIEELRLRFTANSGSSGAQLAELQVWGVPAPTPDLAIANVTSSPSAPTDAQQLKLGATVTNTGTAASAATTVAFALDGQAVGTADVGALAVGASATVTTTVPARTAGSYPLTATVDPQNTQLELSESNNTASGTAVVVTETPSADLVPVVAWAPSAPQAGQTTQFQVAVRNQGTLASSATAHTVTVEILSGSTTVATLTGSLSGAVNAGATSSPIAVGSWTAANGNYTVRAAVAADAAELPSRRANNTASTPLFIGRGANMPYTTMEAEDGTVGGGANVVGPNRTVGDIAGEASGRRAAVLDGTGEYVQWTTTAPTNTLVTRFSTPDAAGGGGASSTLNLYIDGQFVRALDLNSRFAWLYGDETSPADQPGAGAPRHIYDEASFLLGETYPAGTVIKLQKDSSNTAARYAIDFIDLEVATAKPNPDPAKYIEPTGFTHQAVQDALDRFRQDTTGALKGVYLPAGDYSTAQKFQVYGKAVEVIGAGPWYTRFFAPQSQSGTDIGFRAESTANGSRFAHFAYFGNYTTRIDGPGKVFDFTNVKNMTIDDIWVEHMICMFWASNMDDSEVINSRIRNTFADAINMTNGSSGNRVANNAARGTGDDSFALFAATDNGGTGQSGNLFENLTSTLTWRAAGLAVYGGQDNTFRNIYIADTLVYSGVTISSLDFGYPMEGFGPGKTLFDGITLVRAGGHFWGQQTFPAMWLFSASKTFTAIDVRNVDIIDPTYSGIMFQTKYSGGPENTFQNTTFQNITITGARKSGDAFDAKSGFGIWVNEMPEAGQGPAVGSATFTNLVMSGNAQDVRNTTSTFSLLIQ
ncbi:discoidin domain-containing protein [Protaetiibacter sp. SSC-01]|uniref:CARDB domain-containing protein n=1 Tax=Protaetiibacter sp. SSC-01 TaxID=2759943 RepID=UPI0016573C82|nr:CARDB domain-containing protein [Protaetiibacter sp. SSC-01]QNO36922.1 discoidin domain-containing protein [Protaetiibacter sp. SSC-01]